MVASLYRRLKAKLALWRYDRRNARIARDWKRLLDADAAFARSLEGLERHERKRALRELQNGQATIRAGRRLTAAYARLRATWDRAGVPRAERRAMLRAAGREGLNLSWLEAAGIAPRVPAPPRRQRLAT